MSKIELRRCPCGKIPKDLEVESHGSKWFYVCGDCCGEWNIEFRSNYNLPGFAEAMRLAIEAWNNAARDSGFSYTGDGDETFGKRLAYILRENSEKAHEFSKRSGIKEPQLSLILNNKRGPSFDTLVKIVRCTDHDVDLRWLLMGS